MLLRRNAGGAIFSLVVNQRTVAVEGEAVVEIAPDIIEGQKLFIGSEPMDLAGKRAGGVVEVEVFAVEAEEKDERHHDGDEGRIDELRNAPAANDEEHSSP